MAELATVARPYAEAVFEMASQQKQLELWSTVLGKLSLVVQTPEFEQVPQNPKVSVAQLVELLTAVLDGEKPATLELVKRFLEQLIRHRRLNTLPEICKQFLHMQDAANNISEVTIYTAYPLEDKQLKELLPTLEKRFGTKLRPQIKIDESLIGGVCAVVGDDTLDLSVKARLEKMKSTLTA